METTGKSGSVALIGDEGKVCGFKTADDPMSHLKNLIPMTAAMLSEAGIAKSELTHIAASVGPGSFTGIRIGVSTARALCRCFDIPAVAVPTLEGFLHKKELAEFTAPDSDTVVCAIINARRNQVYGIIDGYMPSSSCLIGDIIKIINEKVLPAGKKVLFLGDGVDAYAKQIEDGIADASKFEYAPAENRYQDAVSVGLLAYQKVKAGELLDAEDLLPEYMRKAEAEQKLEAGQLPICRGPRQE